VTIHDQAILIETPAFVELEGAEVITFVAKGKDYALYKVIGFEEDPIVLVDHRQKGLETLDMVLKSKHIEKFPDGFCHAANVRISETVEGILIELYDLDNNIMPELMLWITTEIEEPIPDYKFDFFRIKQRTNSFYSFVSLFNYCRFQSHFDGTVDQKLLQIQAENQI
jgi:hypothetical protein